MFRLCLLCAIITLISPPACAYDLALDVAAPDDTTIGSSVTDLFKIRNLDHETGVKENLTVAVDYTITHLEDNTSVNNSFTVSGVNSWKTAGTGSWTPDAPGTYRIEGRITNADEVNDTNPENDRAANNVSVHDTSALSCDWQVAIAPEKTSLGIGEAARFRLAVNCTNCTGLPENVVVSYWVQDSTGSIVKKPYNWTAAGVAAEDTSSLRSWTADEKGTYALHARMLETSCNDEHVENDQAKEPIVVSFHAVNESCNVTSAIDAPFVYDGSRHYINVSSNTTAPHSLRFRCRLEDFYGALLDEESGVSFIDGEERIRCSLRPPKAAGVTAYRFLFAIDGPGCRVDAGNLSAWQPVIVVGERPRSVRHPSRSDLDLEVDQDTTYEWGDTISVKLDVYRGDTRKYQVRVWAEDEKEDRVSSTLKVNLDDKHTRNEFVLPLALDETGPSGNHTIRVVAEGLGERSERGITVVNNESRTEKTAASAKGAEERGETGDAGGESSVIEETGVEEEENERVEKEEQKVRILDAPREAMAGEEFEVVVGIRATNESIEGRLYAYVYKENRLLSEGFDGRGWSRRWDANAVNVSVPAGEEKRVSISMRMLDAATTGEYILKARMKTDGGNLEDIREIRIRPKNDSTPHAPRIRPAQTRGNESSPTQLPQDEQSSKNALDIPTGHTVKSNPPNSPQGNPQVLLAALLLVTILLIALAIFALRWAFAFPEEKPHDVAHVKKPPRPPADPGCPAPLWER